jgi:hypothetical protein
MVIAFAGIYSTNTLISIIITWWIYKVAMGAAYTPLSYIGLWLLQDKDAAGKPDQIKEEKISA